MKTSIVSNRVSQFIAIVAAAGMTIATPFTTAEAAVFAKFDGVDGEATDANHDKWIDVLSVDWGVHRPGGGATGQSRRRGAAIVEDLTLTIEYEKASPKLQEKCLRGEIIRKLEIQHTAGSGGRATYLKYELTNVMITSFRVQSDETKDENADGTVDDRRPIMHVSLNFEEIKVTYTELDSDGQPAGEVEYEWSVEEGA